VNKFIYGIIVVALLAIVGILMFKSPKTKDTGGNSGNNTSSGDLNQPSSSLTGDIAMKGATATLYYGDGCPHCANIEKWLQDNNYLPGVTITQSSVDSWISTAKIKFNIKEVWKNKTNSTEMSSKATACGISPDQTGVPFLYDDTSKKCIIGETDIQNFFSTK